MKTYLRILNFARPFSRYVPLYFAFTLLGTFFGLLNFTFLIPLLNVLFDEVPKSEAVQMVSLPEFSVSIEYGKALFNYYFGTILLETGKAGALKFVCLIILASVLLSNLFKYLGQRVIVQLRARVVKNLRHDVYERITQLQLGYFTNERKGDLMSRMTNDVQEIESSVISTLTTVVREPVAIIGFFIILFTMSVKLTLFTLIILPLSGIIISALSKKLKRKAKEGQHSLGSILTVIDETLGGMRVIKGFNAQPYIMRKFKEENDRYARIVKSMFNSRDLASPLSEVLGVGVVTIILYYGGSMVLNNESELSAAEFIAYVVFFSQVLVPAKALSSSFSNIQRGLVAGERILSIIDTQPTIRDKADARQLQQFENQIEFRNVRFSYEKDTVLDNINLTIPKGKTVALVGPSGSGKSTLADLLPRFYDPTAGGIFIDGTDIKDCTLHSVRNFMGIVTQESILFNDTIFNNIAFNKENPTMEEVVAAAKIANAHEFIMQTPDGYETMIGDRGSKLSGGQRQRLSIARAVLKNPPILILDEATSALDTESEKLVQQALTNLMQSRTSLVIAHRLSTIQHADEIIVMQHGKIVERGTHDELSMNNGLYSKLNQMQVSG
ncbi:ABC transporter ATP-binding protein [Adhaeribacter sp. BT258]|uniref:ABC transporter ATP-binding protein n=1 Tax=Adhaeribacter terrigena TaxID=2793070 RepID=A0ABS1C1Y7_9BACT|nr:ABC transporter ATP-binding protein [Adhaeribacter terrigena]MBK0403414.1 ABC transporter ATP-binding protein [Adhaeribacter terrigena]